MIDSENLTRINELIQSRRSVYPAQYNGEVIEEEQLKIVLENANWAPTHKLTEPWRFKVITGEARGRLADFMAKKYLETNQDEFNEVKYNKLKTNPRKAGAILLICLQRDPKERVPEWEEIASVAMAVQNMWLTCHALNIGAYWSSPPYINMMGEFTDLSENERCIGLFYMGHYDVSAGGPNRTAIDSKIKWIKQ